MSFANFARRHSGELLKNAKQCLVTFMNVAIGKKSFRALVITHFLTVLNDNLYKFLLVFFLLEGKGLAENARVLSYVSLFFALPFLLLAPLAGSLSDRYQKRNIILATRFVEILCTSLGLYFFYIQSAFGGYVVLILMACHTAVFGPAKLGILPEILPLDSLSKANGMMTAATYMGSILGSCLAPLFVDLSGGLSENGYVISTAFCVVSSIFSMGVSLFIRPSNVKNKSQKITLVSFKDLWKIFKDTRNVHYLTVSIFLIAFFLLVGAFVQVEIIPFVEFTLGYPKHYGGYLFPLVALGVGCGSYCTGIVSGKDIKLGYTPITAVCIGIALMSLGVFSASLFSVMVSLLLLGVFGGIYQVPLHAYVQYVSPEHKRGQILAANNFLDFFGVLISAGIIRVLGSGLSLTPESSFFYMGWVVCLLGIFMLGLWREQIYRLLLSTSHRFLYGAKPLDITLQPSCYIISARSLSEAKSMLARFPQTVRGELLVLDPQQQPGFIMRSCLPMIDVGEGYLNDSWVSAQVTRIQKLLAIPPYLCLICIGEKDKVREFTKLLEGQVSVVMVGEG